MKVSGVTVTQGSLTHSFEETNDSKDLHVIFRDNLIIVNYKNKGMTERKSHAFRNAEAVYIEAVDK